MSRLEYIKIDFLVIEAVTFGAVMSGVNLINTLNIENTSSDDILGLDIDITSPQGLIEKATYRLEVLPKNLKITVNTLEPKFNQKYLLSLEKEVHGEIILTIKADDESVSTIIRPIDIYPYHYWLGAETFPELTAVYITPNEPQIEDIVNVATPFLKKWTKSQNFEGYKVGDYNRVQAEAASIYAAIKENRLQLKATSDCISPQSLSVSGAAKARQASKMELGTIFCSAIEKIGLNPILAVFEQDVVCGVWLDDRTFPDSLGDDITELSKKFAVNEIILIDASCLAQDTQGGFDNAKDAAARLLYLQEEFRFFVDIKRSRLSYIYPIYRRVLGENGYEAQKDPNITYHTPPDKLRIIGDIPSLNILPKQKYWERKLLDLSLKNMLLNFKVTRNILPVLCTNLSLSASQLASGKEFDLLPVNKELENNLNERQIGLGAVFADKYEKLIEQELVQGKLRIALGENALNLGVLNAYRKYKQSIEENGVCTLYFAMGILKWYESEVSMRPLYAPLILLPVDIVRKTARKYVTKARDDEAYFNITLLELLRQNYYIDISGLDPLPKDLSGNIDVSAILHRVRKAIMSQPRWDIAEESYIGNFSFSGIVMWNDIRYKLGNFKKTPILKSLITGVPFNKTSLEISDIDDRWLKETILLPIEADSSQLEAIYCAEKNTSFVLHGPPGTGKSQTITNIIANCLYKGERVLFVAEKMAALSVVKKRLEEIGIGAYCLELHSDKTSKKDILESLRKTSEITKIKEPAEDFDQLKEKLEKARAELAEFMTKMRREQKFGISLSKAIAKYLDYTFGNQFEFDKNLLETADAQVIERWENKLYELKAIGMDMGHPITNSLKAFKVREYSLTLRQEGEQLIKDYLRAINKLRMHTDDFSHIAPLKSICTYDGFFALYEVFLYLSKGQVPFELAEQDDAEVLEKLIGYAGIGAQMESAQNTLNQKYDLNVYYNIDPIKTLYDYQKSKGIKRLFIKNKIIRHLKNAALPNIKIRKSYLQDFTLLCEIANLGISLGGGKDYMAKHLKTFDGENYIYCKQYLENYQNFRTRLHEISQDADVRLAILKYRPSKELIKDWDAFFVIHNRLGKLFEIDYSEIYQQGDFWFNQLTESAMLWSMTELKERCAYNAIRAEVCEMGLGFVAEAYDKGLDHDMLIPAYKKSLLKGIIEYIIADDKELNHFTGRLFENKIRAFKELEQKYRLLSRQVLKARLSKNLPNFDIVSSHMSELGIFQRAIKSSGRSLTIKKLFEQIPYILPKVAPCMLMSPVTVAQYINSNDSFDILIFDEASQLTTAKAVGALARAKTAIVVGDPKQLPPTTFFENLNSNDEDSSSEDLESVLDDCLAINMPEIHLKWHYRSRDESLIAYSNRMFYDNSLYTFPSPSGIASAIRFVKVDGIYDRGNTKRNIEEAKAVVAEIERRLLTPELRTKSIGVVTFSIVQQNLIDDMLTELFHKKPQLEQYALSGGEPLFIKNLENVQGDERDVILFSVGYGADKSGRLSLNFGPINREGGWRRLNVAVSRAKQEMVVFSSITYDMIPQSTTTEGVKALRGFLEYAQKGRDYLYTRADKLKQYDKGVENSIASQLKRYGYECDTAVGSSGYKINIAIRHPAKPNEYVLGIMCDGLSYFEVKTVKDREVSPFNVLKNLGWKLMRVWAVDYWDNPDKVIRSIIERVENELNNMGVTEDEDIMLEREIAKTLPKPQKEKITNTLETEYKRAVLPVKIVPSSYFSTEYHQPHLIKCVNKIIASEAPVSYRAILKQVLSSSGIARLGSRIEAQMQHVLSHVKCKTTTEGSNVFYWAHDADIAAYNQYRKHKEGHARSLDDISIYEIINAIRYVIETQIALPKEALVDEVAKVFGSKMTEEGSRQVLRAIKYGLEKDIITTDLSKGVVIASKNLKVFE